MAKKVMDFTKNREVFPKTEMEKLGAMSFGKYLLPRVVKKWAVGPFSLVNLPMGIQYKYKPMAPMP
jgi:hypothetical protein